MKRQITFAILLFSSLGAFAQELTKEDLDKEIKPLTQKVNSLQSENSKLKSEIGKNNTFLFCLMSPFCP
jgi:chaperonin cofactor prefoldin